MMKYQFLSQFWWVNLEPILGQLDIKTQNRLQVDTPPFVLQYCRNKIMLIEVKNCVKIVIILEMFCVGKVQET